MALSYKMLLITGLSFSLHAMEQDTLIAPDITTQKQKSNNHFYTIDNVYKKAYSTLDSYHSTNHQSVQNIITLITKINELKTQNIEVKDIGQFAYKQPIKTKILASKNPHNSPLYVSVLFDRIKQYDHLLEKNGFLCPTMEQFTQYTYNQKITNTVAKAEKAKIFIDLAAINAEHKILADLSFNVTSAIQQLNALLKDISETMTLSSEEIKIVAALIYNRASLTYNPEIKNELLEKSEKL